jgi:hypothetical protein
MYKQFSLQLACGLAAAGLATSAFAAAHVLTGPKLKVVFADPANGLADTDTNRVDSITWTNSSGTAISDYVANGGPLHCGDPQEFFGQSYGEPEGTTPLLVYAGTQATWTGNKATSGKTKTTDTSCPDYPPPDAVTLSNYQVFKTQTQRNQLLVKRTFQFNAATPVFSGHAMRAYVPRLPLGVYPLVLIPNAAGTAINTVNAGNCSSDCEINDWNGSWFADDDGAGNGMMVIRAKSSMAPAFITVNNDSYSAANLSSIVLTQPAGGWKAPVTEVEALCFYDPLSWPASARNTGKFPKGCAVPN